MNLSSKRFVPGGEVVADDDVAVSYCDPHGNVTSGVLTRRPCTVVPPGQYGLGRNADGDVAIASTDAPFPFRANPSDEEAISQELGSPLGGTVYDDSVIGDL
jgi:hypothetical protein